MIVFRINDWRQPPDFVDNKSTSAANAHKTWGEPWGYTET